MPESNCLPRIVPLFDAPGAHPNNSYYQEVICHALKEILPSNMHNTQGMDQDLREDHRQAFLALLPLLKATPCQTVPANISFFVVSQYRSNSFKFFFDMISHWLVPGKRLNVPLFYAVDFRIPDFGQEIYTLCEVMVRVEQMEELEELQKNWPIIESEIGLGMQSGYYARRILEIKGLAADAKTAMIQEYMAYLMKRLPSHFDHDLLSEMQYVLVIGHDEFKAIRESRHLSRIISTHYLFRKSLRDAVKVSPEKRHLNLRLLEATIQLPSGEKSVLGVLVGINFVRDKEVFEERHLLSAIQSYIPTAQAVEQSFFSNRRGNENICTLYLEIVKSNNERFTAEEIRLLRRELPADLKDRIEHLMHPIFMPRNEEEIMRNILSLSNQIKYLHDLPQVIISFDKQTTTDLCFTVILVQVMKPGSPSVQERFKAIQTPLEYVHERSKTVGFLRKKYVKEAVVFVAKFPKNQFLRRDHSIDLNRARQTVLTELTKVVGEVRDFNGGMISKQHELLCTLREQLHGCPKYNELLLENFFYSLTPDVMRTVLEPQVLRSLFSLLLESIDEGFFNGTNYSLKMQQDPRHVFAMIKTEEISLKESIQRSISEFDLTSSRLARSFVQVYDVAYLGYLFHCDDVQQRHAFCQTLQACLQQVGKKEES